MDGDTVVFRQFCHQVVQGQVGLLGHPLADRDFHGLKFAVASGSKKALIAYFDAANTWWVAREARKHKSTVLAVAWHPSSQVLATVATVMALGSGISD
jgi:hypothetical protein